MTFAKFNCSKRGFGNSFKRAKKLKIIKNKHEMFEFHTKNHDLRIF